LDVEDRHNKRNHSTTKYNYLYQQQQLLYLGTTLNQNLLKHANAPAIPTEKHPHPKYPYQRIKITTHDPELQHLMKQTQLKTPSEQISAISPELLTCHCPNQIKFVKILDTQIHDENEAMVWTACRHTTFAAAKRQMKAAPTPEPTVADDFVQHSMNIIKTEIGDELKNFKYSVKDWYNHLNMKKKKELKPVMDYYNRDKTYHLQPKIIKNILNKHYTGILKEELQPTDGKPRMVCSIPQSTKYIMGPITWQMEEIFQDKLQGYCGGQNLEEMAEKINHYLAEGFTKVVEGDGSAFDNTQDVSLKELDRQIYQIITPNVYHVPKEDFVEVSQALYKTMDIEYIDKQTKKKKNLLTYTILGTVFSGDCDTTLMNTTRMAMYNRYVNDKAGLVFGKDYICFAKGDDFTVMYKPYVTDEFITRAYYKYFLKANPDTTKPDTRIYGLGQVLKMLEFGDASTLSFCSLRAFFTDPTETKIYLTRDPKKFINLSKYSRKAKNKTLEYVYDYLIAQAEALEANYPKITYFLYMANLYRKQAQYLKNKFNLKQSGHYKQQLYKLILKEMNQPLDEDEMFFDKLEQIYKDTVTHRKQQFKILTNYWDTMKLIEKRQTTQLTQQQADYINLQINAEFMIEYLKSMLPTEAQ